VLRVIRELLYHEPAGRGTDIARALQHLDRVLSRRAVVFLISDFQAPDFSGPLRVVCHRHDLIPVVVRDEREERLPPVRFIELEDAETGRRVVVDTSSRAFRELFARRAGGVRETLRQQLRRSGLDTIEVATGESFVEPLRKFFRKRGGAR
jgi:uncharacterized protein (DUF58 family)